MASSVTKKAINLRELLSQLPLIPGVSIKTIDNKSILGSGNISLPYSKAKILFLGE